MQTQPLSIEILLTFEDYQRWAMERVLAAAHAAGTAANAASIPGSNMGGTVHGLLGHMVDADIHWLNRWLGNERSGLQMPGAWSTIEEVETAWRTDLPRREGFFRTLDENALRREFGYYRGNLPERYSNVMWQAILHAQNHTTHHRAEVCALLTTAGFAPESTDLLDYLRR
ncbi:MAG: DinB family protein [Dehalococcoidia bacterium]